MNKLSLEDRMRGYEKVAKSYLMKREPVIVRVDGRSFKTFTRGMDQPFDIVLLESMIQTMKYLCENIDGCVFGYTQSDEITLVLTDYRTINTEAWFGYAKEKVISITASMATYAFNKYFARNVKEFKESLLDDKNVETVKMLRFYDAAIDRGAIFDCRAFNCPIDDVCNNIIWRQEDAVRNSVLRVGYTYLTKKEMENASTSEVKKMLVDSRGIDWNMIPPPFKYGCGCIKVPIEKVVNVKGVKKTVSSTEWVIDRNIPVIVDNREYVESRIHVRED